VEIFDRLLLEFGDVQVWAARTALLPFLTLSALGTFATILSLAALLTLTPVRALALLTVALETTFGLKTVVVAFSVTRGALARSSLAARTLAIYLRREWRVWLWRGGFRCLRRGHWLNHLGGGLNGLRYGSFERGLHGCFSWFGLWFWGNGLSGGSGYF
jgi:hypothetical protein